jgi:hypothetical protein
MPEPFDPKKFDEKLTQGTIEWTSRLRREARYRTTVSTIAGVAFAIVAFVALTSGKLLGALILLGLSGGMFYSAKQHSENL